MFLSTALCDNFADDLRSGWGISCWTTKELKLPNIWAGEINKWPYKLLKLRQDLIGSFNV
ncbi:hypothetical protein M7I_2149 [Glarea lozoyensis 74030]|uniref:Uncharacterized protein n=1 Tax=Glarea lozoyensis (strain ATCC 74030 / MF5533) TaxID=1104152 RepID=H0EI04_GLAL7|nr:hypothetical protein M7I_2149 [Glarea lozoyensis 74030]